MAFNAHEVLEAAWKNGPDDERMLWQGLAQQQLPIGKEYEGLPWCSQEYNGKLGFTQWDWADADTSLVVVIDQKGSVSITHGPDSQGREGCA